MKRVYNPDFLGNKSDPSLEEDLAPQVIPPMVRQPVSLPQEAPMDAPVSAFPSLAQVSPPEQMAQGDDLNAFSEALAQAREREQANNLIKATNALLGTGGLYHKGKATDMSPYDNVLDASTKAGFGKAQDLQSKEKFGQDLDTGKLSKIKVQDQTKERDPNSDTSKTFRKAIEKVAPWIVGQYGPDWDKVAASDKENIWDMVKTKEQIDARRELAREKANAPKDEASKLELLDRRETLKEEAQVKKENRKNLVEMDKSESSAKAMLNDLRTAKDRFLQYSKGMGTGTGPLATLGGLTKFVSQDTEKLDAAFKKVSMDNMVKQFAGMSKAIDSDVERRAFESTQPSITNDDGTNLQILNDQIAAAERLLAKIQAYKKQYDRSTGAQVANAKPDASENQEPPSNEEVRLTKDGKRAIFDKDTKKFIRWAD